MARIQKKYVFEDGNGRMELHELFQSRRRLIVYHFPFDPRWDGDCGTSSHLADRLAGGFVHLPARDTSFAAVSCAPIANIESCKERMGWTFPWLSSLGSTFNEDFRAAPDDPRGGGDAEGERPGLSVFVRKGSVVFHAYSTYGHRLDAFDGVYGSAGATPLRRHDRYPPRQARR
jgi:predicted dithiol-disulfide oxidoreductase (DUF899 family)